MEIHCPNCKAVYRVDETKIPDKGAYTRCKKCRFRFLVQKETETPVSGPDSVVMNSSSDEEKLVQQYIANDDLESAASLLLDLITKFAKKKNFSKAESLRDKLNHSIPLALNEIVKANEVIEKEKTNSIDQVHLEIWNDFYQSLDPSETVEFYYSMKELDIEPGQSVFSQGEKNLNLYFVQRGVLTLSFNHPKEEKQVFLKEVEVGSVANTAAFFLSTICTFSLKAKTESKIKYLEKDILLKWKKEFPRLVSELNRFCMTKEDISGLVKKREQNLRAHERLKVSLKAEVQYLDHMGKPFGKRLRVMLSDISEGGLCFESAITKREAADRLLENQLIMDIFYQTSAGEQKEIRKGRIVAVNIIPFSKSTIHVQFDKLLNKTVIESIKP
jgi:predicted Zn finger-like uncharacterized protein